MDGITVSQAATWGIAAVATGGVIIRPWGVSEAIWAVLGGISWGIIPLVAGLFVLVAGIDNTGLVTRLTALLKWGLSESATATAWMSGIGLGLLTNLTNNLPAGLITENVATRANPPSLVTGALLIDLDLGPNLSVTGWLATVLWLIALRREDETCSAIAFLRVGVLVMPPALLLALAALFLTS